MGGRLGSPVGVVRCGALPCANERLLSSRTSYYCAPSLLAPEWHLLDETTVLTDVDVRQKGCGVRAAYTQYEAKLYS